jgi:hypothetical protein
VVEECSTAAAAVAAGVSVSRAALRHRRSP